MTARDIDLLFLPLSPAMFYAVGIREEPYFPIMKVPGDWLSGVFIGSKGAPNFAAHWMLADHAEHDENGLDLETHRLQDGADPVDLLEQILAGFALPHGCVAIADATHPDVLKRLQVGMTVADLLQSVKDERGVANRSIPVRTSCLWWNRK